MCKMFIGIVYFLGIAVCTNICFPSVFLLHFVDDVHILEYFNKNNQLLLHRKTFSIFNFLHI